jgi:hypothetical protein
MNTFKNTFDPELHEYWIGRYQVPSVTRVLRDLIPGWSASDWYLERGRSVHACAAFVAQGKNFTVPECAIGQVVALRRFFSEVKPIVKDVERQVYSERWQYAGTLDLLTQKPGTDAPMILDFKASLTLSVAYQCAAYALAYRLCSSPIKWGCGVEIRENGSYQMGEIYDLRKYQQDWLNLLGSYNVRRKCGIKEMEDAA